ncbi:MAG: GPP34 family phosphoprotein, partial [Actinoallomurus sp.]
MSLPRSLPARLYLLAYDLDKERMTSRTQLGLVLRAAALADLYLDRRLADEDGKARV